MQKVLIITYYWPPAGGPGVQRWLKFVEYLPDFGWIPIVFVPENPTYPILDESLVQKVPPGIKVIQHPIIEPYRWAKLFSQKKTKRISKGIIASHQKQSLLERLLLWVRGNLFIPDARKFWVNPAADRLMQLIKKEEITTVITTGPPHSVHLIGLELKRTLKVQWLADFRDPWTSIGYHKKLKLTRASQHKHKRLEKEVVNGADRILVTSTTTKKEFQELTAKPIEVITNGYDTEPLKVPLDSKFTISHLGSLLTDRNPVALWEVLSELVDEAPTFGEYLKIQLIGVVGEGVLETIAKAGLRPYVDIPGYVSYDQVLEFQSRSQVLLLLEIDAPETRGIIPGKLFEYFIASRPILAIGPEGWEAGEMVEKHQAGCYVHQTEKETLKKLLLEWFHKFQQGGLSIYPNQIAQYHRRELTKQLANSLTWESS